MAELVDALDSGSSRGNSVDVRVILVALFFHYNAALFGFRLAGSHLSPRKRARNCGTSSNTFFKQN